MRKMARFLRKGLGLNDFSVENEYKEVPRDQKVAGATIMHTKHGENHQNKDNKRVTKNKMHLRNKHSNRLL